MEKIVTRISKTLGVTFVFVMVYIVYYGFQHNLFAGLL